jgi:hypothetical protein
LLVRIARDTTNTLEGWHITSAEEMPTAAQPSGLGSLRAASLQHHRGACQPHLRSDSPASYEVIPMAVLELVLLSTTVQGGSWFCNRRRTRPTSPKRVSPCRIPSSTSAGADTSLQLWIVRFGHGEFYTVLLPSLGVGILIVGPRCLSLVSCCFRAALCFVVLLSTSLKRKIEPDDGDLRNKSRNHVSP